MFNTNFSNSKPVVQPFKGWKTKELEACGLSKKI